MIYTELLFIIGDDDETVMFIVVLPN